MKLPFTTRASLTLPRNLPKTGKLYIISFLLVIYVSGTSCSAIHNLFAPKTGCPSDGKNVGAERILSGEKVPRASKFKA